MKKQFIIAAAIALNLTAADKANADNTKKVFIACPTELVFQIETYKFNLVYTSTTQTDLGQISWGGANFIDSYPVPSPQKITDNCTAKDKENVSCTLQPTYSTGGYKNTDPNRNITNLKCGYSLSGQGLLEVYPEASTDPDRIESCDAFRQDTIHGFECSITATALPENKNKKH